jgi:hypothetical protein
MTKQIYLYATVTYKGYDTDRDAAIRKAACNIVGVNEMGSGFYFGNGKRDLGFKVAEYKKEVFKNAMKTVHCRVAFSKWV